MTHIRATDDAYLGIDDASPEAWDAWHRAMLRERDEAVARAGLDPRGYTDRATDWSDTTFRQFFLFMYDTSFYDRERGLYRTAQLVERWTTMFGRVDSVLLWHAYPRIGFDERGQFDFYRDMPGGLARLRAEVSDVFHAHGIRVFVDYNPWADGGYAELAEIVAALDADGVMLDTMTDAPDVLAREVLRRRDGVVFAPELRPSIGDLARHRQAWAQWADIGSGAEPSILRHRWIFPRHRQFAIRRWDHSRRSDIVYSFFNGSGLLLWDNIFGSWNPYSRADRRLIAETAAVIDRYYDLFVHGEWLPLVPTGVSGLDANHWSRDGRAIVTLRNRTTSPLAFRAPPISPGRACRAFWGDRKPLAPGDAVIVEPLGTQAIVMDDADALGRAIEHFDRLATRADVTLSDDDERTPRPRLQTAPHRSATAKPASMVELPGGDFTMRVRHERRECGCYPLGATDAVLWGWFYKDVIEHVVPTAITSFAMRRTAVTNAEFLAFVQASDYRPRDAERFLKHLRDATGALPRLLLADVGELPVTFVSLDDARAYAEWHGERLPTEAEWQWAAEGAGRGNRFPWGNEPRTTHDGLRSADEPDTATPQGVLGLSGNAWELTESEHDDGHTRFVMLRGGIFLPPGESEWLVARGARPNDSHAKYLLATDGLDRSSTISFRTCVSRT